MSDGSICNTTSVLEHQPPWGSESVRGWNEQASWSVTCNRPSLPGRGSRCQQGGRCGACVVVVIK